MKTCPYCVAEIPDEAQKCRHCGEWVVPPPSGSVPARVEVTLARRKPTWADRLGIGCAVAILLAIVLGLGAAFAATAFPEAAHSVVDWFRGLAP